MRMKTYLKQKQQSEDYQPRTWVWIKSCWRPVKNHRFIKRGKKVGWVRVELYWPEGKTVIVPVTCMKFADVTNGSTKLQKSQKSVKKISGNVPIR